MKILSWNIAGGRKDLPDRSLGYEGREDLVYFSNKIKECGPDVIMLQETHSNDKRILAEEIAARLGMPYVFNTPASPSHIDPEYSLGNAIISKFPIHEQSAVFYPNPWFDLVFKDGRKGVQHPKNLQTVKIENIYFANTQMLPIRIFGYEYDHGLGNELALSIERVLENLVDKKPLVLAGDFNFNDPQSVYLKFFSKTNLKEVLPAKPTRPDGKSRHDHIYRSEDIKIISSEIYETFSDHYICFVEIGK
jgi:endonuclease/exonuclease/phosphatase family metal-dependent hydrolase